VLNAYAVVVLVALLVELALHAAGDLLELRALAPEPPAELAGVHDREAYRRSQAYTRAKIRFGLLVSVVQLAVLLAFWLAGGFGWLDRATRDLGLAPIPTGLAFVGALVLGRQVLFLPFSLWSTFRLEERFGFNRTDARTFWLDRAKMLVLGALIGAPLLAAVLWLFRETGPLAWLWAWLTLTAVTLLVQFVAPAWILPLFHRFQPLEDGELRTRLLDYARGVGFPLEDVYVIDGSRRSTKSNAFFTGFGRHKRVALFDTLVERHSTDELLAVVAHEIGHYRRRHIQQGLAVSVLHAGVLLALLGVFLNRPGLYAAFGVDTPSVHVGLVLFALLYTPVELALEIAMSALSRRNEYQADEFAARTTGAPNALAAALRKLAADNLANLTPHPFQVALGHSHPPLLARIEALHRLEREVGGGAA
jgi:STE24 endopeptidase